MTPERESLLAEADSYCSPRHFSRDIVPAKDLIRRLSSALRADEGWREIASAPLDGTPVLLWYPNERISGGEHVAMARWQKGFWSFQTHVAWGATVKGMPTHWRPLPPPPDQGTEG